MPIGGTKARQIAQLRSPGGAAPYGGRMNDPRKPVRSMLHNTVLDFQGISDRLQSQRPEQTAFYQTQRGQLADFLRRQTERDAGSAARRGLTGSEFELAQAGQRQATAAGGERAALAGAEERLRTDRETALARLLQSLGLYSGFATNQRQISAQQRAAYAQAVGSAVGQTAGAFA